MALAEQSVYKPIGVNYKEILLGVGTVLTCMDPFQEPPQVYCSNFAA
jgi:hypothetical protein